MYKLQKILPSAICLLNFLNSMSGNLIENSFKVDSTFFDNSDQTKVGNIMQCKIVNIISNRTVINSDTTGSSENIPVDGIKINTTGTEEAYSFFEVQNNTKCASFQVRAASYVHIALSDVQISTAPQMMEIVIGYNGNSLIRQRSDLKPLVIVSTPEYLNDKENHGFWIQWTDDHLIAVGRESETVPFIKYRSLTPLLVKYFGIQTWSVPGSWTLYGNRNCPGITNNETTEKYIHAATQCQWVPVRVNGSNPICHNSTATCNNLPSNLQNQQTDIYNELKVEFNIYNSIPSRTRALSHRILQEIEEQYMKAKEIQKNIFAKDNTTNTQTFESIIELFYRFYELIQKDLLKCFQACRP